MRGSVARWIGDVFLGDGSRLRIGDGTGLLLGRRRLGILPPCLRKGRRDGRCHHDEERCQKHKHAAHGSNYTAWRGGDKASSEKAKNVDFGCTTPAYSGNALPHPERW